MYDRRHVAALVLLGTIVWLTSAGTAQAHGGSVQPVASNYLAKISHVPAGIAAKVVDGDLRLWMRASASITVLVLDYRGAPYLRFDRKGVQVNHNSGMYYLNQTPVAAAPPGTLTATTRPHWVLARGSHDYSWHDGRLHALATVALAPGAAYVGAWTIPVTIDGRRTAVTGELLHAARPSIVWFWPILVLLACVIAATRLRRPSLDRRVARAVGITALLALAVAGIGRELHGHPGVSPTQYVELGIILAFVAWGLHRILLRQHGYFTYFVVALAVLWEGLGLISILRDGFVLINLPPFLARTATMLCLACGAAILPLAFRLVELPEGDPARTRATPDELAADDPDGALEIG